MTGEGVTISSPVMQLARRALSAANDQIHELTAERDRARATAVALWDELELRLQLGLADATEATAIAEAATERWLDDGAVIVDELDKLCHDWAKTHGLLAISPEDLEWDE